MKKPVTKDERIQALEKRLRLLEIVIEELCKRIDEKMKKIEG